MVAFVPVVFEAIGLVAIVFPHFMQVTTFAGTYLPIAMGAFLHAMQAFVVIFHFPVLQAGDIAFSATVIGQFFRRLGGGNRGSKNKGYTEC